MVLSTNPVAKKKLKGGIHTIFPFFGFTQPPKPVALFGGWGGPGFGRRGWGLGAMTKNFTVVFGGGRLGGEWVRGSEPPTRVDLGVRPQKIPRGWGMGKKGDWGKKQPPSGGEEMGLVGGRGWGFWGVVGTWGFFGPLKIPRPRTLWGWAVERGGGGFWGKREPRVPCAPTVECLGSRQKEEKKKGKKGGGLLPLDSSFHSQTSVKVGWAGGSWRVVMVGAGGKTPRGGRGGSSPSLPLSFPQKGKMMGGKKRWA